MLHANPLMTDIDVNHWRNLQLLLLDSAKTKPRIVLIHEDGELLKFVHSKRIDIVRNVDRVDNPHAVAEKVYRANQGTADFVVVFERRGADSYFAEFQESWKAEEDLDEFVHRQFALLDEYADSIVTFPHSARETLGLQWRVGASYEDVVAAVGRFVPRNSSVVFGIFEGGTVWATLVLRFDADQRVTVVTTVDPSELGAGDSREAVAGEVVDWVNRRYGPCSIGLFTDLEGARAFLSSKDKTSTIRDLLGKGQLVANPIPESLSALLTV